MEGIKKTKDGATHNFGEKVKEHALLAKGAEVQELETRSVRMDDGGGVGNAVILRRFSYQLPPKTKFSKVEILAHHKPRITPFLWKDGLEEIAEPKVVLGKKGKFDIFVRCQARRGQLLYERPLSLQQAMTQNAKNS